MKSWHTFLRTEVFPQERYGLTKTEQAIFLSKFPSQETVKTNKQVADRAIKDDELPSNPETVRKHMWTIYNERFCPKDGKEGFPGYKQKSRNKDREFLAWLKQRYLQWLETFNSDTPLQSASEANHVIQVSPAVLGKLSSHVPDLPLNSLPRIDALKDLKKLVLDGKNQPVAVTGTALRVGVQGMGGIGKSVLAAMLARDEEVRYSFPDGILWVTLGQNPALTLRQLDLAKMLGDSSQIFHDVQQGRVHLSELLVNKACLVILDDVWQSKHAEAFNALGQKCKMLITTRDNKVLQELGAVGCLLGLLEDEQALTLLALWAKQEKETLPVEADEVVRECGNLPLALAMIGALVQSKPDRWGNLLYKLRNADLEKIRYQFPDYPYPNLLKAIQVSIEALETDIQKRYLDFAVFPEDTPIPETMLQTFWEPEGLDEFDTQDVVDALVERSLARRDDRGCLTLHDLQYDYVRKQAGNLQSLHNRFVNSYSSRCSNGWHTGPNDGYFFENLTYHLHESGRKEELYKLLTKSPDWMEAKFIACTGDTAYVADLDLAISDFADPLEANQLLMLIQLYTARQAVNLRVSGYFNTDLETLVWLGCEDEALSHARLRSDLEYRLNGLLTIYKALQEKARPNYSLLDEASEIAQVVNDYEEQIRILSKLAATLTQAGRKIEADTIFTDLAELAWAEKEDEENGTESGLRELAVALGQAERFAEAEEILEAIENNEDRVWVLKELAAALAKSGREIEALAVFDEAIEGAAMEDYELWIETSVELIEALIQFGYFSEAEEIVRSDDDYLFQALALSKLGTVLEQVGDFTKANIIFAEVAELIPRIEVDCYQHWAMSELAIALAKSGRREEAKNIMLKKAKVVLKLKDAYALAESRRTLALALALAGYKTEVEAIFIKAEELAQTIEDEPRQALVLRKLAVSLAQAGYKDKSHKILGRDIEVTKNIEEAHRQGWRLCQLAVAMAESGLTTEAKTAFDEVIKLIHKVENNSEQARLLEHLSISLAQAKYFTEAEKVVQEINQDWDKESALLELVQAMSKNKCFIEAKQVIQMIEKDCRTAWARKYFAIELAKAGEFIEAQKVIEMIDIERNFERAEPIKEVVIALAKARAFTEAEELAQMIEINSDYVEALGGLAAGLIQAGRKEEANAFVEEAREFLQTIESSYFKKKVVENLANALGRVGSFPEALRTLDIQEMDKFLSTLAEWLEAFEEVQPKLSIIIMREVIRIAGWVRPDWQEIYDVFPA